MERFSLISVFLYFSLQVLIPFSFGHPLCSSHDSLALLHFKQSLATTDATPHYYVCNYSLPLKTMSWNGSADCCTWDGVTCDNFTGRVIGLDLSCSQLEGTIHPNSSLFQLRHLQTLDLSANNFSGSPIPDAFSNLQQLTLLDLGYNTFGGPFPSSLVNNLTKLEYLSLMDASLTGPLPLTANGLQNLETLDLYFNSLNGSIPSWMFSLPSLIDLVLGSNHFSGPLPLTSNGFQNLKTLHLSFNSLNGSIPSWMFSFPSLIDLELRSNHFSGPLPEFKSKSLHVLELSDNQLSGPIPQSFKHLVNLTGLFLGTNNMSGEVGAEMFSSMANLGYLDLSWSGLSWSNSRDDINITIPSLSTLLLISCGVKFFPDFLLNSKDLLFLFLSENEIQGMFPVWFKDFSLLALNVSHNHLTSLDHLSWQSMRVVDLRSNSLTGPLPSSLCKPNNLRLLDLSHNNLSGEIPNCLFISETLSILELRGNNFHGPIPNIFWGGYGLRHIGLSDNQLEGPVPRSLVNCTSLQVLDLGNNKISDTFPTWMGTLQELEILIMKSNRFYGPIVALQSKSPFQNLRIFDLSGNSFAGSLPTKVLKGFKAMTNMYAKDSNLAYMQIKSIYIINYIGTYKESLVLVIKNREIEFKKVLTIFTAIDLSRNKFEGEIPKSVGNLNSLLQLNLSHNWLTGNIPGEMKSMSMLEALDLSSNQLIGKIPVELTSLTFLEVLNLSHNHLVGPIPHGKQFNTFTNDSYVGNHDLCGFPLSNECGNKGAPSVLVVEQEDESSFFSEFTWSSVLIGYGCGLILGFTILYLIWPRWFTDLFSSMTHESRYKAKRGSHKRRNFRRRRR